MFDIFYSIYFKLPHVFIFQDALKYGLKHHILPKKVKQDEIKTNVGKLIYFLKRKDPSIHIDNEFQDQTKFYVTRFSIECNRLCSTNRNQSLHSALHKLRQNENIKIQGVHKVRVHFKQLTALFVSAIKIICKKN